MKINIKNSLILLPTIALFALFFSGCVKEDPYIDWKKMNDEWYNAHKTDGEISKKMNWQVAKGTIYDKVSIPLQLSSSGFSYRVIRLGNPSDRTPNQTSYILANYEKKLIDGTTFSSGTNYSLGRVSLLEAGLKEIVLKMHHGDVYELYLPYQLTFDSSGDIVNSSIPIYSTIIYRIELVDSSY